MAKARKGVLKIENAAESEITAVERNERRFIASL
jgi:hypothetical protein